MEKWNDGREGDSLLLTHSASCDACDAGRKLKHLIPMFEVETATINKTWEVKEKGGDEMTIEENGRTEKFG